MSCCAPTRSISPYLGRYTNAAWLVIQAPGEADDGLFARNEAGEPLVLDAQGGLTSALQTDVDARVVGDARLPDGRRAVPVFQLLAERYLDTKYAPEAVAERCGIPADRIRGIAAEIAATAFEQEIEIAQPWTDWAGRRHATMRGRPGLDPCDARHLGPFQRVPDLPRAASAADHRSARSMCRAAGATNRLIPKPAPPGPKPAGKPGQVAPGKPLGGAPLGFSWDRRI